MAVTNQTGVFHLESGLWAYRYTFTKDGKRFFKRSSKDQLGNSMKTKREAVKARALAMEQQTSGSSDPIVRHTVKVVYMEFCENRRKDRTYQTKRKQDSLWENHLGGGWNVLRTFNHPRPHRRANRHNYSHADSIHPTVRCPDR